MAVAGLADISVGETLCNVGEELPLPILHIDEPTLQMKFGVNSSPFSGKDGKFLKDELTLKIVEKPKIEDLDVEVGRDIIMRLCTMVGDGVNLEHWLDSGCVRTNTGR